MWNFCLTGDGTTPVPPDKTVHYSGIKENITHDSKDVNLDPEITNPSTENTGHDLHENKVLPKTSTKCTDNVKLDEQTDWADESDVDDLGEFPALQ